MKSHTGILGQTLKFKASPQRLIGTADQHDQFFPIQLMSTLSEYRLLSSGAACHSKTTPSKA
eukprot:1146629-Pelagomonas_calceolata.AAC.3